MILISCFQKLFLTDKVLKVILIKGSLGQWLELWASNPEVLSSKSQRYIVSTKSLDIQDKLLEFENLHAQILAVCHIYAFLLIA